MPDFEIICLANSRKRQGRCVAGIRTDGQGWIRPVGWNTDGSLSPHNYWLANATEAQVLDVIRLRCIRPYAKPHHPEDWTIAQSQWQLVSRPASPEHITLLRKFLLPGPTLFGNALEKIPAAQFKKFPADSSLALIAPENLQWTVRETNGKRKTTAQFSLCGARYQLTLTDPVYEERLSSLRVGTYPREAAGLPKNAVVWLTISLSEPFRKELKAEEFCYKLVTGVVVLPSAPAPIRSPAAPPAAEMPEFASPELEPPDWSWLESAPVPPSEKPEILEKPIAEHVTAPQTFSARIYERWTEAEDERLIGMVKAGRTSEEIAATLKRPQGEIWKRIGKLVMDGRCRLI